MVFDEETGEIVANRMIASTLISEEIKKALEALDLETRIALERMIADGLIEEKDGRLYPTLVGLDTVEDWIDKRNEE
jgi:glutathionyl-hydroquinone reductase